MSWSERLDEVQELLIGLGTAAVVLVLIAWLFGLSGAGTQRREAVRRTPKSQEPTGEDAQQPSRTQTAEASATTPEVAALYIAPRAGKPMQRVDRTEVVAGRGLAGDRYFLEAGHWSGTDDCEVTIIAQEDIDDMERQFGVRIQNGEHRRNIVVRNLPLEHLTGRRFRIGSARFGYDCPRPPCAYIQMVSEPGMAKALGRRAGICVRCIRGGMIEEGDEIVVSTITLLQALKYRFRLIIRSWRTGNHEHI